MPRLPTLTPDKPASRSRDADSVVFAVFAPFGTDAILSQYPQAAQRPIHQQALVQALKQVAMQGVHVCALIDLFDDDSYWVEIPAKQPARMQIVSAWKQDMSHPRALAGFLRHVSHRYPCSDVVLALEGHGAGYLPELDATRITIDSVTGNGQYEWTTSQGSVSVAPGPGSPALPVVSPELPVVSPELPAARLPLTTVGLARALRLAQSRGARRPAIIHFNNCFNLSFELLHAVRKLADHATAYSNYNFFTAGAAYPAVFGRLRAAGSASAAQVARWFAETNQFALDSKGNHPTMGGTVCLKDMGDLGTRVDKLADALCLALTTAPNDVAREKVATDIEKAIRQAQQYDTLADYHLDVPDQLTDLRALAAALESATSLGAAVTGAAGQLESALSGLRVYGSADRPHPKPSEFWDFRTPPLAINILLPDPVRQGLWDWRSPYYLHPRANPAAPTAMTEQTEFLRSSRWVDFIIEYHRKVAFKGLLPALAPVFPVFRRDYKPPADVQQVPPKR